MVLVNAVRSCFCLSKRPQRRKVKVGEDAQVGSNALLALHARWVEDGDLVTSSGVSAGMDMSLAVIARQKGLELAEKVAVWTEYDWHRDPDWDPFAEIHGLV